MSGARAVKLTACRQLIFKQLHKQCDLSTCHLKSDSPMMERRSMPDETDVGNRKTANSILQRSGPTIGESNKLAGHLDRNNVEIQVGWTGLGNETTIARWHFFQQLHRHVG